MPPADRQPQPADHQLPPADHPPPPPFERAALRRLVRQVPDFPTAGVLFADITPLLADAGAYRHVIEQLIRPYRGRVDQVAAIEARGFILGAPAALALGAGFVPLRKAGKLPSATVTADYLLEYGSATLEMHADALGSGHRVLVVDDVIATGGTAQAAVDLIRSTGAEVVAVAALLEIPGLGGIRLLQQHVGVHLVLD